MQSGKSVLLVGLSLLTLSDGRPATTSALLDHEIDDAVQEHELDDAVQESWGAIFGKTECSPTSSKLCPLKEMPKQKGKCHQAASLMRIGGDSLPVQNRGVFWLTGQGSNSALISFAQSNDGRGVSPGTIPADGGYPVRVSGDRTWSFMIEGAGKGDNFMDLVYHFKFNSATDPTFAVITPEAANFLGLKLPASEYLLKFTMSLVRKGDFDKYPDSYVWQRKSSAFGSHVSSADYDAVQVIDENGKPLPAFWDFVRHCYSKEAGDSPGYFFYREYKP